MLCAKPLVAANYRLFQRTHNEDTAEVALEVVPVVAIVHPKDLILFQTHIRTDYQKLVIRRLTCTEMRCSIR